MNNTYGIPRIGLLPYSREDGSQYFPQGYIDAIEMTGAEVVPVMHDTPLDTLYPLVISLDAMIFSGGGDIAPVHYGQVRAPGCGRIDPRRDQIELALADLVLGAQHSLRWASAGACSCINVALGGTLKQDIPGHRVSESSGDPVWHDVRLSTRPRGLAADCSERPRRARQQLPPSGRSTAWRTDWPPPPGRRAASIEAVEMPGERFFVGVQWHPEKSLHGRRQFFRQAIFKALRAAMR